MFVRTKVFRTEFHSMEKKTMHPVSCHSNDTFWDGRIITRDHDTPLGRFIYPKKYIFPGTEDNPASRFP